MINMACGSFYIRDDYQKQYIQKSSFMFRFCSMAENRPNELRIIDPTVAIQPVTLKPPEPGEQGEIVMTGIRQQWLNQEFVDYTLVTADGVEFRVHRSHMACFSDYISTMLFGE